jgi:hypothetical protein
MQARSSVGVVLDRVFRDHPHALGETYWQHQRRALHFGGAMITAGVACLIHALVPAVFVRTASGRVQSLHDEMQAAGRLGDLPNGRSHPGGRDPLPEYGSALGL